MRATSHSQPSLGLVRELFAEQRPSRRSRTVSGLSWHARLALLHFYLIQLRRIGRDIERDILVRLRLLVGHGCSFHTLLASTVTCRKVALLFVG